MPACEKCWGDAYTRSRANGDRQTDVYVELLKDRDASGHTCTPEQQRGDRPEDLTPGATGREE